MQQPDYSPLLDHIESYWSKLLRTNTADVGTLIGLPQTYIVPSQAEIFQQLYYWDSYFILQGLIGTKREHLIPGTAENFMFLLNRFGMIPTGSRYYLLSRSQPPFSTKIFRMAYEVKSARGDADADAFLARAMALAEAEHQRVWLGTSHPHVRLVHAGLSRYFDVNGVHELANMESGWDRATRCGQRWLDHLPVCLNSILYQREQDFAWFAQKTGNKAQAAHWSEQARQRAGKMKDLMWDEDQAFFFDYDYVNVHRDPEASLAGFYPLWARMVSQEDADRMVAAWLPRFRAPGGLLTSLSSVEGHQFGAPNGFAPIMWLAIQGLDNYGYGKIGDEIVRQWCDTVFADFQKRGHLVEKYNVAAPGAAPMEDRYETVIGSAWTSSLFLAFLKRLEKAAP
jgi:alpha,alpha-trehalase